MSVRIDIYMIKPIRWSNWLGKDEVDPGSKVGDSAKIMYGRGNLEGVVLKVDYNMS